MEFNTFDPTPALEHDRNNYSPLNDRRAMNGSEDHLREMDNNITREVRFSEPSYISHERHSIATSHVPLLPPVSSASQIPKQSFRFHNLPHPSSGIDFQAYTEQCRHVIEQLRKTHEAERQSWDIERTALRSRITNLEFKLRKSRDPTRRSSNEHVPPSIHQFRMDFAKPRTDRRNLRTASEPHASAIAQSAPPVWEGPRDIPPVTRVFSNEDTVDHMQSVPEDAILPELSKEISPTAPEPDEHVPVPVEHVDPQLDGIRVNARALTSNFVAKIQSPHFSPVHTPSPRPRVATDGHLKVDVAGLLSPLDEKLKRNAGHTPMTFDGTTSTDGNSTQGLPTPKQEKPLAPAPTGRPPLRPTENSDSYFSFTSDGRRAADADTESDAEPIPVPVHETQDDPELKGPLMLQTDPKSDMANDFLSQVDAKLSEVEHSRKDSVISDSVEGSSNGHNPQNLDGAGSEPKSSDKEVDFDMPRLRLKSSKNFGSAYGTNKPGRN